MLEFINSNGVLFSGIFTVIGALIPVLVSVIKGNKSNKIETIKSLRKELSEKTNELNRAKEELAKANSIKEAEKSIDKTHGAIYKETFDDGTQRDICGYCWEKEHKKIPLVVDIYDDNGQRYFGGYCSLCKNHCTEKVDSDILSEPYNNTDVEDLNIDFEDFLS